MDWKDTGTFHTKALLKYDNTQHHESEQIFQRLSQNVSVRSNNTEL